MLSASDECLLKCSHNESRFEYCFQSIRCAEHGGGEVEAIHIFINPTWSNIYREAKGERGEGEGGVSGDKRDVSRGRRKYE